MLCQTGFLALLTLGLVDASPTPRFKKRNAEGARFVLKDVEATREASPLVQSENVLTMKPSRQKAKGSSALLAAVRASHTTALLPCEEDAGYAIDINFGGKTFEVVFDTGSSDLWLAEKGFKCVNVNMTSVPDADCAFGPLASPTFQDGKIPNENFNITYGDGEFLTGFMGYENVEVGGITVDKQEVALVNRAYWEGDNITSGLMGFAYPSLTSAFKGTNPAVDNQNTTDVLYTNWVFNAIDQGLINPMFSVVMDRGNNGGGGQLALGGLPSTSYNKTFTSTPLHIAELIPDSNAAKNYSFYTILPDGYLLEGAVESFWGPHEIEVERNTDYYAIVDSGTTLMYLPPRIAEEVNALFDPPSVWIEDEGVYENDCNAKPPKFAVRINGTDFYINPKDILITGEEGYDPSTGGCLVGIQPSGDGIPNIYGDTFMKNVVAVFDIGASEMRFAPHEYY
jgi:hypothetical protein